MEDSSALSPRAARAVRTLEADLQNIFGSRLTSLVLYGRHVATNAAKAGHSSPAGRAGDAAHDGREAIHTLALVSGLSYTDLTNCAARAEAWDRAGLAMPLLLSPEEFASSLDVFPLEYGAIIARHVAIVGRDPFHGIRVNTDDLRRACEVQAKSHLIHLREGFLQTEGRGQAVARLIHDSVDSFATLLTNLADLDGMPTDGSASGLAVFAGTRIGLSENFVNRLLTIPDRPALATDEAVQLYPPYLDASEKLARFVDGWKESSRA